MPGRPRGVVSYRNSTSNHNVPRLPHVEGRVVSYRNSTSNHNAGRSQLNFSSVVSYRNSTSNHNLWTTKSASEIVVSYRNSTSNHNQRPLRVAIIMLYLIEILHQTTTCGKCEDCLRRCILSKFYIKPQHPHAQFWKQKVVSYRNSTSNHNYDDFGNRDSDVVSYRNSTSNHNRIFGLLRILLLYLIEILHQTTTMYLSGLQCGLLYLIEILHQTTTVPVICGPSIRCILSKFYIKPQRFSERIAEVEVVSYRNSTSNHNRNPNHLYLQELYLIEILHQTTTGFGIYREAAKLYLIEILHQTTTLPEL